MSATSKRAAALQFLLLLSSEASANHVHLHATQTDHNFSHYCHGASWEQISVDRNAAPRTGAAQLKKSAQVLITNQGEKTPPPPLQAKVCLCFCVSSLARGKLWPKWWYQISHQVHAGQFIIKIFPWARAKSEQIASDAIFKPAGQTFQWRRPAGGLHMRTGRPLPLSLPTRAAIKWWNFDTTAAMSRRLKMSE